MECLRCLLAKSVCSVCVCVCCAKMGWKIQLAKSLLKEHELEQTLGESEGKGSLVCYSPWGPKDSDTT